MLKDKQELIQMGKNAEKIAITEVEDKIYNEIKRLIKWFCRGRSGQPSPTYYKNLIMEVKNGFRKFAKRNRI